MNDLVFDRTQLDVTDKTWKGYYNTSDLNRVEEWCRYLADELNAVGYNIQITTKTNWVQTDLRTASEMERIRTNIKKIMQGFHYLTNIEQNANNFDYIKANNWEKILFEIFNLMWGMEDWYVYSGVANSGQNRLWQHRFRQFFVSPIVPVGDYILTEENENLVTENNEPIDITIGMYVDESGNQIITEDNNKWEVE